MHPAKQYIEDILSGEIVSCQYVKWAVERHVNDLERFSGEGSPYKFDEEDAQWYIGIYNYMRLWEGRAAGKEFKLDGWKQFVVWSIYGWKQIKAKCPKCLENEEEVYNSVEDSNTLLIKECDSCGEEVTGVEPVWVRRFKYAFVEVARKNAKSTLAAGVEITGFGFDGENGAQVYSAATKADQAKICFDITKNIINMSPHLRDRWTVHTYNISDIETASKIEYLGANAMKMDGFNPSTMVIDEFHAHPNGDLFNVLVSAAGSRLQPLFFIITTSGFNKNGPWWEKRNYVIDVLDPDNPAEDDSWFGIIFTLDEKDDWEDESVWVKANPSLGNIKSKDNMRDEARRAKKVPSELNNFLTKHLNVPTDAETAFIPSKLWNECNMYTFDIEKMKGRPCYIGIDLGSVSDFCATSFLMEPWGEYKKWDVFTKYYIPKDNFRERKNADIILPWINEGFITTTPGNATDYAYIEKDIREMITKLNLVEEGFGYDPYKSTDIMQRLAQDDIVSVPVRQGYITMNSAVDEMERMILAKEINFGNDPVLSWMNGNTVIVKDPAGNRKPDKSKSQDKIDGIVALLVAIDRAKAEKEDTSSIYDDDPVIASA